MTKQRSSKRISVLEDKQDSNEIDAIEALLEKIEECPSKKVREALKDSLNKENTTTDKDCLLYTSPSPRDGLLSRMPSSA